MESGTSTDLEQEYYTVQDKKKRLALEGLFVMPKNIHLLFEHKNSSNANVGAGATHLAPQYLTQSHYI